jgi:hypothetical protein
LKPGFSHINSAFVMAGSPLAGLATDFGRLRRETPTAAAGESPPSHRVMSLLRSLKERVWKKQLGDCGRAEESR